MPGSVRVTGAPAREAGGKAFRPDIEGLRAVAVIAVVLYHLKFPFAPGGFVGVDVFFTISGFLMAEIVAAEVQSGTFAIWRFYRRRILRIWPAMCFLMLATVIAGMILLLPIHLVELGDTVLASLVLASNVLLWLQTNYFAPAAEANPLLHLWSLAVEQQFYLFVPLLVPIAAAGRRGHLRLLVVAFLIASLVLCIVMTPRMPVASFYLLPTRIWEFLLGSRVALYGGELVGRAWANELASGAGIAMIVAAAALLNTGVRFPGFWALLPCAGAALVIGANANGLTLAGRVLALPPSVVIGRLSYSIYLWHWPILTYCRLEGISIEPMAVKISIIAATLLCSYLSWRFVEAPFRGSGVVPVRLRLSGLATAMSLLAATAAVAIETDGLPIRLDRRTRDLLAYQSYPPRAALYREGQCFLRMEQPAADFNESNCDAGNSGGPRLLLWGDSHAAHYAYGLRDAAARVGIEFVQATYAGCAPIPFRATKFPGCADFANTIWTLALTQKFDAIVISANWTGYPGILPELSTVVRDLTRMGRFVVVVGPSVEFRNSLPVLLAERGASAASDAREQPGWLTDAAADLDRRMRESFSGAANVFYLSPLAEVCPGGTCPVVLGDGVPLTWDASHLTAEGSILVSSLLLEKLLPVVRKQSAAAEQPKL
jgi:peptidoglycan/LPS O-acetylase OafA/YrhL